MKNRVVLILPYFGKLPSYFDLWLSSAASNRKFDFLIITDQNVRADYAENIRVIRTTFDEVRRLIQEHINFRISLNSPYKLCDYKPAYGEVFQQYIKEYEFWGHCDSDIIWGNLFRFINNDVLDDFDRIYNLGHLTLYRNNGIMNHIYKEKFPYRDCISYKYAFTTNFVMAFDEVGTKYGYGISEVCKRTGVKQYLSIDFADTIPYSYNFRLANLNHNTITYFEYKDGKVIGYDGSREREFAYIHLQKRLMHNGVQDPGHFYISPYGFCDTAPEAIAQAESVELRNWFNRKCWLNKFGRKIDKIKDGALKHLLDSKLGKINI